LKEWAPSKILVDGTKTAPDHKPIEIFAVQQALAFDQKYL
jgi:hypothetical protein